MTTAYTGLQEGLYIDGYALALNPKGYVPQGSRVETNEIMADTSTLTSRPVPFVGCADLLEKFSASLNWDSVNPTDLSKFRDINSKAWPFDFTDWIPITEWFSGDGTTRTITLSRRMALISASPLPDGASTKYATEVYVDDVPDPSWSYGTPSTLGRVVLTTSLTPTVGYGNILVRYVPLYLVRVVGSDRGYPGDSFAESRALKLSEVA